MELEENKWSYQHFPWHGMTEGINNKAISLNSDLNSGPLEYKDRMLTIMQWYLIVHECRLILLQAYILICIDYGIFSYESIKALAGNCCQNLRLFPYLSVIWYHSAD
jgi:hypothetical protein